MKKRGLGIVTAILIAALFAGCGSAAVIADSEIGKAAEAQSAVSETEDTGSTEEVNSDASAKDPESRSENESSNEAAGSDSEDMEVNGTLEQGTRTERGMIVDNTLHTDDLGDIHFSSYIPDSYDGSEPYALFLTLPGWEGLYFQGVGANLGEDTPFEARNYNDKMIILSAQLDDWGETSANMAIRLTEYFLQNYNIDRSRVYLNGYSGGGETGSLVVSKRPDLYTAYLEFSSRWDGGDDGYDRVVEDELPVYFAIGEDDSYYGSSYLKEAYQTLHDKYEAKGLTEDQIGQLLVLDVKDQSYFDEGGIEDQHAGGILFSRDSAIMGWLFGDHPAVTK